MTELIGSNDFIVRRHNISKLDPDKKQTGLHREADGVQNASLSGLFIIQALRLKSALSVC